MTIEDRVSSALMAQKDDLLYRLNSIDPSQCVKAADISALYDRVEGVIDTLSFSMRLWGYLGYAYKGREIALRIRQILSEVDDEKMSVQRKRGDLLRNKTLVLGDEFGNLQQEYFDARL